MPFGFFDPTFMLLIPALIFAFWAQAKVSSSFKKYSRVANSNGMSGAQVARRILDSHGLFDVEVEAVQGRLSDHYDPTVRKVRLSEENYANPSVAGLAVAAHEVGHAIQHKEGYAALKFRHVLARPLQFGSWMAFPLFFLGMILSMPALIDFGIILFALILVFHVVTLPVEFNASSRALKILENDGYLVNDETRGARAVLNAAALTYVAAATMAATQLFRMLMIRGMMGDD